MDECCSSSSSVRIARGRFQRKMNKANQYLSEVFRLARPSTEYGDEFLTKKKRVEYRKKLSDRLTASTQKFLFPNDLVSRIKISSGGSAKEPASKMGHPEEVVAEALLAGVQEVGVEGFAPGELSRALYDTSIAFKSLAGLKARLVEDVVSHFIRPQSQLKKDYTQLLALKKKLENRRLDYDCRKRKMEKAGSTVSEEELRIAEKKFYDLKSVTDEAMSAFIQKDTERVGQLKSLQRALLNYHKQAAELLEQLEKTSGSNLEPVASANQATINVRSIRLEVESTGAGKKANIGSPTSSNNDNDDVFVEDETNSVAIIGEPSHLTASPDPELPTSPAIEDTGAYSPVMINNGRSDGKPHDYNNNNNDAHFCQALDDFEPSDDHRADTLSFKRGETIEIIGPSSDDNWLWGRSLISGQIGYVPTSYVVHIASPSSPPPLALSTTPDSSDHANMDVDNNNDDDGNNSTNQHPPAIYSPTSNGFATAV